MLVRNLNKAPLRLVFTAVLLVLAGETLAQEPAAQPAPTAPAAPTPGLTPLALLQDARAGEAFIGKELTVEGVFLGMFAIDASEQIMVPRKYRKTHTRFMMSGEAGSTTRNLIVPTEQASALFTTALGTKIRVTGTLEHMVSPAMVQPTSANRLLVVSRIETF